VFRQRLGDAGSDPVLLVAVERAARLTAYAELLSAKALRGQNVSADDVIRAHRASDMAVRRLHLDRHKQPAPAPTLMQYLGQRRDDEVPP
jgi:hypothetical protein